MDYDPEDNYIKLKFYGFENLQQWEGFYLYKVTLFDKRNLFREYVGNITIIGPEKEEHVPRWHEIPITIQGYIVNVTKYGDALIEFSKPMDTSGVNLAHINSSLLDIFIAPFENYFEDIDDFNVTKFNCTWKAVEFYDRYLKIKITFGDAPWISQNENGRDVLVVHIKNAEVNWVYYRRREL